MRDIRLSKLRLLLLTIFLVGGLSAGVAAIEKCNICHGKEDHHKIEESGRRVPLYVTEEQVNSSVHNGKICTDCHVDIVEIPHKDVKQVNCGRCHYSGNPVGAPGGEIFDQYQHSVHGMEVAKGNPKSPICKDCHGTHEILKHDSPESVMYKQNIPKTCGKCHIDIYATFRESQHGTALEEGNLDSPDCSSCHGEHDIARHTVPESKVARGHVSETCSECHGPKGVVAKYGIKTDRTATFEESFHGVAQIMESQMVANCASCHGYHDIRSHDDPKSSIYIDNIPATCGKPDCHPEATISFASGQIHVDPKSEESGLLYYISKFFLILTVSTLVGLLVFILLDLIRRAKSARAKR